MPGLSKGQAPRGPLQQLCAQMLFKRGDLLADGWLADTERAGDCREAPAVDHPNEQNHGAQTIQAATLSIPN